MMSQINPEDEPIDQLRSLMHAVISMSADPDGNHCGCMVVNTMVECSPLDEDIQAVIDAGYTKRMETLAEMVAYAQQRDQVNSKLPAEQVAEMICTLEAGIAATLKSTLSYQQAKLMTDDFIALIQ